MMPDATNHNPSPLYLRGLIKAAGMTQARAALAIGVSVRSMRGYLSDAVIETHADAPYSVQFALEALAGAHQ